MRHAVAVHTHLVPDCMHRPGPQQTGGSNMHMRAHPHIQVVTMLGPRLPDALSVPCALLPHLPLGPAWEDVQGLSLRGRAGRRAGRWVHVCMHSCTSSALSMRSCCCLLPAALAQPFCMGRPTRWGHSATLGLPGCRAASDSCRPGVPRPSRRMAAGAGRHAWQDLRRQAAPPVSSSTRLLRQVLRGWAGSSAEPCV